MLIGYARVSTDDQNLDLQLDALQQAECDEVFCDKGFSGVLRSRPALEDALNTLGAGDTLITWRLDRLGRSLSHLISLVADLEGRGVPFDRSPMLSTPAYPLAGFSFICWERWPNLSAPS